MSNHTHFSIAWEFSQWISQQAGWCETNKEWFGSRRFFLARQRFYKHRVELTVVPNESHAIVTYTELSHCQSLGAADLLEGFIKSLECNFHVSSATSNIQNRLVASMWTTSSNTVQMKYLITRSLSTPRKTHLDKECSSQINSWGWHSMYEREQSEKWLNTQACVIWSERREKSRTQSGYYAVVSHYIFAQMIKAKQTLLKIIMVTFQINI